MKTDAERGPFAAWLRRETRARGWKESEARRRFETAAEAGVSFSSYRDLEAGNRKPTDGQRRAIAKVLGAIPDFATAPAAATDQAGLNVLLINALNRQSTAIEALVQRLDDLAAGQVALAQEVGMVLDPEKARRRLAAARTGTPSESGPSGHAAPKAAP